MPAQIIKIKKLTDGYIIYTDRILLDAEQKAVKAELAQIGGNIGHTFFRIA
jgi:hypothetical protein